MPRHFGLRAREKLDRFWSDQKILAWWLIGGTVVVIVAIGIFIA